MDSSEVYVGLSAYHPDQSPEALTELLAIQPTDARAKGWSRQGSAPLPHNYWNLSSRGRVESKDLNEHLAWLLRSVWPRRRHLRLAQRLGWETIVWCYIASHASNTLLNADRAAVAMLGALRLEIALDVYYFGDESGPASTPA